MRRPGESRSIAASRGADIDPRDLSCYWRDGFSAIVPEEKLRSTPLGALWAAYSEHLNQAILSWNKDIYDSVADARYKAWVFRQRERYRSELPGPDYHPFTVVAFELSKGCSRNCWFCAFGAGKLEGVFPYTPENAALWRNLLRQCSHIFGAACRSALCYRTTEPFDNPDYLSFVRDFKDTLGVIPRTTTAGAAQDLKRTRELLTLALEDCQVPSIPCRFSILSVAELRRIHEAFTPLELLRVILRQHQEGSLEPKVISGKVRDHNPKDAGENGNEILLVDRKSISCIVGFLVNMVDKTIKLLSQCVPCHRWPMGYRVHFEDTFQTAKDFGRVVRRAIKEFMPGSLRLDQLVSFRSGISYHPLPQGFRLTSPTAVRTVEGQGAYGRVGDRIYQGRHTLGQILDKTAEDEDDPSTAAQVVNWLFDQGLLTDETDPR